MLILSTYYSLNTVELLPEQVAVGLKDTLMRRSFPNDDVLFTSSLWGSLLVMLRARHHEYAT